MKTFENVIAAANEVFKSTSAERREWNKEYYSLSKLLRDAQQKSRMERTAPIFAAIGLPINGKVSPSYVLDSLSWEQWIEDKQGNACVCLWNRVQAKDKDGNKLFEQDGVTPVMVDHCSRINEGTWTLNKLVKLISQRNAFIAAAEAEAASK